VASTASRSAAGGAALAAARQAAAVAPGLILAIAIAWAAKSVAGFLPFPAVFVALALGVAVAGFAASGPAEAGLTVGGRDLLRAGVALLGAQVTLTEIAGLGPEPFLIAIASVLVTLGLGYPLARAIGVARGPALLAAGGVAICGASAILAIAAVLPKGRASDEEAAATVAAVTILGTIGMIAFPVAAAALGLSPTATGIFLGATLHEVVQAVGAGFSVSDPVGETATAVKLIRVACLAPVVILLGWAAQRGQAKMPEAKVAILPWFLVGFIALAALSSLHVLPPLWIAAMGEASRWCLLVGIAALGAKLSIPRLLAIGARPAIALSAQSLIIAGFALGMILLFGIG